MGISTGALGHELFATSLHPTLPVRSGKCRLDIKNHLRLIFRVIKYPLLVALNVDVKSGIDELLSGCRREGGTTFEFLRFATKPE